jgi:hypothetical protein
MMMALQGYAPQIQALMSSISPPPPPMAASAVAQTVSDRTTSSDTVTISAAGQQAYQAYQDMNNDGDSN